MYEFTSPNTIRDIIATTKMFLLKNCAKKKDEVIDSMGQKLQVLAGAAGTVSGDVISFSKEGQWSKISGTLTFTKNGSDLEAAYSRASQATSFSYMLGCLSFLITLLGIIVIWYFYDKEGKDFDLAVENASNVVSASGQ